MFSASFSGIGVGNTLDVGVEREECGVFMGLVSSPSPLVVRVCVNDWMSV